jgi:hypothetical protein
VTAEPAYNVPLPNRHAEFISRRQRVQDADRYREFTGYLMHRVSTEVPHKPQWLEIEAWKVTDGTCRYLLHFTGKSVLVHSEDSDCNTGVPTPASELSEDSEPCRKCRPNLATADPDAIFEAETDRHKIEICDGRPKWPDGTLIKGDDGEPLPIEDEGEAWIASAKEMLRILRESWHRNPGTPGTMSAPAQRLVDTLARMDPAIKAATEVVESI